MMRRMVILVILIILLSSCKQESFSTATAINKPTGVLTPFRTSTPSPVQLTATIIFTIPSTPAPTSTPFLHTIKDEDTMLGIAYQYGITLEELQAANPGVDPHYLSVGKTLVIPLNGEIPETIPTSTPAPVQLKPPYCYRSGDGGAWCILPVHNNLEFNVENLSAWMGIFTIEGNNIANQVAYAPLNLLRAGETIPIMVYFSAPLPEQFQVRAELLSSLIIAEDDTRYMNLKIDADRVEISTDGKQAELAGEISHSIDDPLPSQVWLLAVAYDAHGDIIGVRKWESSGDMQFELAVYSLSGKIDRVEILSEIRP